mmetsp:Transcript_2125/g.4883  ORF Transcript_2125/g.4883 Transcript_2125/m.4883 type:complete len:119 (+) Transcript_2125:1705-2061(+)
MDITGSRTFTADDGSLLADKCGGRLRFCDNCSLYSALKESDICRLDCGIKNLNRCHIRAVMECKLSILLENAHKVSQFAVCECLLVKRCNDSLHLLLVLCGELNMDATQRAQKSFQRR